MHGVPYIGRYFPSDLSEILSCINGLKSCRTSPQPRPNNMTLCVTNGRPVSYIYGRCLILISNFQLFTHVARFTIEMDRRDLTGLENHI